MSAQKIFGKNWWLAVLAGALLFLAADSARRLTLFRAATAQGERARPAPLLDPASPTGYQGGQRNQILESADGYNWVMQTQQMIATGNWRIRHVEYDNAPGGREVHWSSPLHWWLALVAWTDHAVSGRPWLVSVEHAAPYAGPLLLGLLLLAVVPWTARRFGAWPAALLAAGLVAVVPFSAEYGTGSFDHHGVAASCSLLTVLFLLAGWLSPPTEARRAFIFSGIAGAAGLWINAATQIPVLVGIGFGALLAQWIARGDKVPPIDPRLWRTWGLAGAAGSLICYLVEYFPSNFGWRLEVNHPLYALAWAGAGDLLARRCTRKGWASVSTPTPVAGAMIALAAPLMLILLVPARTFVVTDKFIWMLHVDYIGEFAPLASLFAGNTLTAAVGTLLVQITVLPLVGLVAIWLLWRGGLAPTHRAMLAFSLPPAVIISLLALAQVRWLHLACALWLAVLVAVGLVTTTTRDFRWTRGRLGVAGIFLAAVLLPYPMHAWRNQAGLSRETVRQFVVRDLAFWLRRRTGADPVVVLSAPTATTELVYHGGFQGVGTLYWENLAGLRALVDIYGAPGPARALELLRQRGVTHLVILPWSPFAQEAARLARGLRATEPVPTGTFALDLLESGRGLPDWVRPLAYRLPETDQFRGQFAFVLAIVPGQLPAAAAVHRAQFLAAMGDAASAQELLQQVLDQTPDHVPALLLQAQFQRAARQRAAHSDTVQHLRSLLTADPRLEPEDRIALALELAAAGQPDAARAQLERCWKFSHENELRRLPPESLPILLRLTSELRAPAPAEYLALAEKLRNGDIPPAIP